MTFDQALAELGIDREAGSAEARRAYLKLLKTRRPETDPQGFMRLREAFDLVKDALAARETFQAARAARAAVQEPAPPPAPEPPADDADPVDEESAKDPAEPEAPAPAEPEIAADTATEEEAAEEPAEEPPSEAEAARLFAAGDRTGAAGELARIFDAAAQDLGRLPPFPRAMNVLLELHEHGEIDAASTLEASVVAWLHASGQEVRLLRGNVAIAWAMTRELGALRRKFPRKARAAIARGVRTGDFGKVQLALVDLRERRPEVAEDAAGRLRVSAPVLAQQFANILDPPAAPQPQAAARSRGTSWGYWGIAVVLLNLVRFLASSSTSSTPTPSTYGDYKSSYSGRQLAVVSRAVRVQEQAHRLTREAGDLSVLASTYAQMDVKAKAVGEEARSDRCSTAWEAMRALDGLGSAGDDQARVEINALARALTDCCGDPAPDIRAAAAVDAGTAANAGVTDAGPRPTKGKGTTKKP